MKYLLLGIFQFFAFVSYAQSPLSSSRGDFSTHLVDRLYHLSDDSSSFLFSNWKPYEKREIAQLTKQNLTDPDIYMYLKRDNWEYLTNFDNSSDRTFLKKLYKNKTDFYHHKDEGIFIKVNPLLQFQVGSDSQTESLLYINSRGLEVSGTIDDKVSFSTMVTENQLRFPSYVRGFQQEFGVIPGLGFWKLLDTDAYDFLFASGHISFQATKHINIQLGHDRFSIGNGYRSLILSNFSNNYPYLKLKTKIWKFQYTNLYAQLTADVNSFSGGTFGIGEFPKKFLTMHHLSMNVSKKLNIGLFEAIVFNRQDSLGNAQFEMAYLNPVIFYRVAEQHTGSPDNALLGIDFNYKVFKGAAIYGQFVIDEFIASDVFGDRGKWSNKYAYQIGAKYFNAFSIDRLDLQFEHNFGRPFIYSHTTGATSYSHYNQPLAHPLGANFKEILGIARYMITPKFSLYGKVVAAEYGLETETSNIGKNILLPNPSRDSDDGNFVGQGINTKLLYGEFRASYMLKHNLFIDLTQILRREDSEIDSRDITNSITTFGIRLNLAERDFTF